MKALSSEQHFPHHKSMGAKVSSLKGKLLWRRWSDLARNKTCPRLYDLSFLPASLTKIRSKWMRYPRKLCLWDFFPSRASNSKANGPIWLEIELVRDFMSILITCKFDEHPIKMKLLSLEEHFPIINLGKISVTVETRLLIQSVQNFMQPFPYPSDAIHKIYDSDIFKFEGVDWRWTIGIL